MSSIFNRHISVLEGFLHVTICVPRELRQRPFIKTRNSARCYTSVIFAIRRRLKRIIYAILGPAEQRAVVRLETLAVSETVYYVPSSILTFFSNCKS